MNAIETKYKGYRFRSRLEARWAVFFDVLGVKWEYEKEGYEFGNGLRYLPDFWLPEWKTWIEIKPELPEVPLAADDTISKLLLFARNAIEKGIGKNVYVLCGNPGLAIFRFDNNKVRLDEGYVALQLSSHTPEQIPIEMQAFAMTNGGKILDIWPMYIHSGFELFSSRLDHIRDFLDLARHQGATIGAVEDDDNALSRADFPPTSTYYTPCFYPCGLIPKLYVGRGIEYEHKRLMNAYTAAKSARFEHGENGAPK